MDMSLVITDNRTAFTTQISHALAAKYPSEIVQNLQIFADQFFDNYPIDEFKGHDINDVVGMVYEGYQFITSFKSRGVSVRAFNPSIKADNWQSKNSVVLIHHADVPFLIDSVRMALVNEGYTVKSIKNMVLNVERDKQGDLLSLGASGGGRSKGSELFVYAEIDRCGNAKDLKAISTMVKKTIADVKLVNGHYASVIGELQQVRDTISFSKSHHSQQEISEANQFVVWLMENNFTFLGYAFYGLTGGKKKPGLVKSYGVLNKKEDIERYFSGSVDELDEDRLSSDPLLTFSKLPIRSNIHRRAYPDHITIQAYDDDGQFVGVHHIVGLYTSRVYRASVSDIPVIRDKVSNIYRAANIPQNSYNGKVLRQVLETFPRDELFQGTEEELGKTLLGIAQINERSLVKLFIRRSPDNKFVNAMAYIPRDLFSTDLREKMIASLGDSVGAESSEFYSYYSESILSRTYMIFRIDPSKEKQWSDSELEQKVQVLAGSWSSALEESVLQVFGEDKAKPIYDTYKDAFTNSYQDNFSSDAAVEDIKTIQALSEDNPIALHFSQPNQADNKVLHFKVFHYGDALPLSDVIPVLERMNLKVIGEHPYQIKQKTKEGEGSVWLHDFLLKTNFSDDTSLGDVKELFESSFINVWQGYAENDEFNGLVLAAKMNWREVAVLRAYAAYMKQTRFPFSRTAIVNALMSYPELAQQLISIFNQRFNPDQNDKRNANLYKLEDSLLESLEKVSNLNDDRIIRHYLALLKGTLRTNYFQQEEGEYKPYISFKFSPRNIPDIPEPRPLYEIFVCSPRVEGVHLRGGKVARGGLRWSDRNEDFRTEVLGLVKAQQVKNSVIVPSGAKGGFVSKKATMAQGRDAFMKEGISCYELFIQGLLDITDNLVKGRCVKPAEVVCHDEDDPYLVVAADKGTATFSDIANKISFRYGHWLGDAFASGGSVGYDHKGMGITARGAWVSVQRHFKEKDINVQKEDFTVVGVGDMAGDVFGNGMLMSEHICLTAAFNHLHIFIDPNPKAAASFKERERLFTTPGTNWADYNKKLISKGGGIFSRDAKSIDISPEMKECFAITASKLTPTDLIHALLKSPVDLIWNGGIGTYVKGGNETHAEIGDKANDSLRVNGSELRCKVFGEGGNLGLSQLGRIEFCANGGACNTDFIDNAAGVDCSDHEVNIKILLNDVVSKGELSEKQRNRLLASMTDTVAEMVLSNNYHQTQSISLSEQEAPARIGEYRRLINSLESSGRLNRELEYIPTDEELVDRDADGHPLTRPELSVLNSYVKVQLKEELAVDEIADNAYLTSWVERAFPPKLLKKYKSNIYNHILRKEIIATQLANDMVDNMGITFCHRLMEATGESAPAIAIAYVAARDVFELDQFKDKVQLLDYKVPAKDQLSLLSNMMRRVRRGTRWFLRNGQKDYDLQKTINLFNGTVKQAIEETPAVLASKEKQVWDDKCAYFEGLGLEPKLANSMAMPGHLFSGLGIAEAARQSKQAIAPAVSMHHLLGDKLGLYWFAHAVTDVKVESYWQAMARESFIDDIDKVLRMMTVEFLRLAGKQYQQEEALQLWMHENPVAVTRWREIAHDLQTTQITDFAMFSVAMRELMDLAEACQECKKLTCG